MTKHVPDYRDKGFGQCVEELVDKFTPSVRARQQQEQQQE